jgi:hypothetical protein
MENGFIDGYQIYLSVADLFLTLSNKNDNFEDTDFKKIEIFVFDIGNINKQWKL